MTPLREQEAYRLHLATRGVDVTGHPDGIAIRYGGEVVEVYPAFLAAKTGLLIARDALVMLSDCLGRK